MDTSKIIKGVVSNGRYTVTAPIVKEDYGLYLKIEGLELPSTYEVDFSNSESSGTSVTMIGNSDGVLIPRQFIDTGKDIFAFLYHVGADFGRTVYKFRIPNKVRPDRTDEQPTPEEQNVIDQTISALNDAVERAEDAEQAIEDMSVSATTLAEGSSATVTKTESEGVVHLAFGIPKGQTGAQGERGEKGDKGDTGAQGIQGERGERGLQGIQGPKGDKGDKGDTGATGAQGIQGAKGDTGADGYSPTVTVTPITGGHRITITDADGEHSADVMDGTGNVDDVQINGTSIVENGVANVPVASSSNIGTVRLREQSFIISQSSGIMDLRFAQTSDAKSGNNSWRPINTTQQHVAAFYGLAKSAGDTTQSQSSNAVGQYTDEAKVAIQKMLGIYQAPWELIREDTFTNAEEADHIISTDANGEAFELTDIRIVFWLPQQETVASKKDAGRITFEVNSNIREYAYLGEWTQQAGAALKGGWAEVIQANGMIELHYLRNTSDASLSNNMVAPFRSSNTWNHFVYDPNGRAYNRVIITKVTGTGRYRLYGRRKWQ